ncbi:hypothetical protein HAX54_016547 [Datura stramonium]|uniref:Protein kinase domain-containing protein n=1 Tax=Datura stramonium TaxID=4076 RepID=A0ABS8S023_DATST|nr:hypothetical protein [Datura stramonium]
MIGQGQNILIGQDGNIKIADLGCGKLLGDEKNAAGSGFSGTPAFMAPEVARGEEQSFPADIWAFGCTVIEMATGGLPQFPNSLSKDAREFLESNSWKVEELKRDSPTSILDQGFWNSSEVMESSSFESTNTIDSAADRIRQLISDEGMSSGSLKPNWAEEEDWMTVRCSDTRKSIISDQNCELIDDFGEIIGHGNISVNIFF